MDETATKLPLTSTKIPTALTKLPLDKLLPPKLPMRPLLFLDNTPFYPRKPSNFRNETNMTDNDRLPSKRNLTPIPPPPQNKNPRVLTKP